MSTALIMASAIGAGALSPSRRLTRSKLEIGGMRAGDNVVIQGAGGAAPNRKTAYPTPARTLIGLFLSRVGR